MYLSNYNKKNHDCIYFMNKELNLQVLNKSLNVI